MLVYKKSIFIFRRDFRLEDNTGLINALELSQEVLPIFIFTPEQLIKNKYKSDNAVQFMLESLQDLEDQLEKYNSKIFYFFGEPDKVLQDIIKNNKIEAVFVNSDYTHYAKLRDDKIKKVCAKFKVDFCEFQDFLLQPVSTVLTGSGTPFLKYTPFFNKAIKIKVSVPKKNKYKNYASKKTKLVSEFLIKGQLEADFEFNKNIAVNGGRENALKILKRIKAKDGDFSDYDKKRNVLIYETTRLSAYIKFGCVSVREVYNAFLQTSSKDLIRQLYWRDFYYNLLGAYPNLLGHAMKEKYDKIVWPKNKILLKKWQEGQTGFPVVDACMRELNQTGFMHNRGRLIVSNFLIKILMQDWREGERYFANKLVDYDVAVNNGNWQWSASTGADSQPYFRIFNPWIQSEKFDPNCEYIKKWVPELKSVKNSDIHKWDKKYKDYSGVKYPAPIIDYEFARKGALVLYKKYIKYT